MNTRERTVHVPGAALLLTVVNRRERAGGIGAHYATPVTASIAYVCNLHDTC